MERLIYLIIIGCLIILIKYQQKEIEIQKEFVRMYRNKLNYYRYGKEELEND